MGSMMVLPENFFAASVQTSQKDSDLMLMEAKIHLADQNYDHATVLAEDVLKHDKKNGEEAKALMSVIREEKITQQNGSQEVLASALNEEQKQIEIEKWLERSKSYLAFHQYDEALHAAERVFLYEPTHLQASRLIDEIYYQALKQGKSDMRILDEDAQKEIRGRLALYHFQAETEIKDHRWGAAQLVVSKILMLDPNDRQALKLKEQLRNK